MPYIGKDNGFMGWCGLLEGKKYSKKRGGYLALLFYLTLGQSLDAFFSGLLQDSTAEA